MTSEKDPLENVPPRLAQPAIGLVGSSVAIDEALSALGELLQNLKTAGSGAGTALDLAKAVEATKAIHALHHKEVRSAHALVTFLISELSERL